MSKEEARVIVIDDEPSMLRVIERTLKRDHLDIETYLSATEALKRIESDPRAVDIVVTDLKMPDMDGFTITEMAKKLNPDIMVIVITAFSSIESAVKAMKLGAYDFIPKPFDPEHLWLVVKKALESRRLMIENINLRQKLSEKDSLNQIVGTSAGIQRVKQMIQKVKDTDVSVLITGESGVGKELVARAIHFGGKRAGGPFIPINCGAVPEELLESELFGYEKGAFTGAVSSKKGLIELAHRGTLFLDEVESLSPKMQVKLLRFLQERCFFRLGGSEMVHVDVRVVSATNEDLQEAVRKGRFRKDLYYRLNVVRIDVPPLRERAEDIPILTRHFLQRAASRMGKEIKGLTEEAEQALLRHNWEGNVRELENVIERAVVLCETDRIDLKDLPPELREKPLSIRTPITSLRELERIHIQNVLQYTGGNKSHAAKILDIDYTTLLRKLRSFGIEP